MNTKSRTLIRASISIIFILLLLYLMRGRYSDILRVLKSTNVPLFASAVLVFIVSSLMASYRLQLIIRAQGIKIFFTESFSLTLVGYFANNFLPTSIGGDVVKAHYLTKKSPDAATSYTAIFVDRAIGLFTMILMAFFAVIIVGVSIVDKRVTYIIYGITIVSILAIVFAANKNFAKKFEFLMKLCRPIENKLRKIYNATNKYRHNPRLITSTILISIVSQLTYFLSISLLVYSVGSAIGFLDVLLRMPIVSIASLIPSINGLGVREGSIVALFGPLITQESAFAVSILMIFVLLIVSLAGAIVWAVSPQFKAGLRELELEANTEAL